MNQLRQKEIKMIEMFSKGDAVYHKAYGKGMVLRTRHNGYEVQVKFNMFTIWVSAKELVRREGGLKLVGSETPRPRSLGSFDDFLQKLFQGSEKKTSETKMVLPTITPPPPHRNAKDAQALEALRLGVVPTNNIMRFTVGRDQEVKRIHDFLSDPSEGAILIEGSYGSGKSHLLEILANSAKRDGYAVAKTGFDPSETAAAFPKKTYRRLMLSFRAPVDDRIVDIREFLEMIVKINGWKDMLGNHPLLGDFLSWVEQGKAEEDDFCWIEGRIHSDKWPILHDHTTCANIYCNILSAISRAGVELLSLKGLLILLDEVEVARQVVYSYQLPRGINLFRGLTLTANDDPILMEEQLIKEDVTQGKETHLIYSGFNPIRYTSGIPSYLKVVFALTPSSLQEEFRKCRDSIETIHIDCLELSQLKELFFRICNTYESVWGIKVDRRERERLFWMIHDKVNRHSVRRYIKATVEVLDYKRFYPQEDVMDMIGRA